MLQGTSKNFLNNLSNEQCVETLTLHVKGRVIRPEDPAYEAERKGWNAGIDRHPALIVQCADVGDVQATVNFAREHQLLLSVRSGGHSVPGYSSNDGGVILDLSFMKKITIDPDRHTARLEPGVVWKEVARALQPYNLALSSGDTGSVGVGGLLLGGGIGWMVRKYGLSIDHVRALELVTADGQFLRASAEENAELFWGLRGAGANFGVATAFEVDVHPGGTVLGGMLFLETTDPERTLQELFHLASQAPDELSIQAILMLAPPAPFIPEDKQGRPVIALRLCYTGDISEGERVVAPFRQLANPIADLIAPIPYEGIFAFNELGEVRTMQHFGGTYFVKTTTPEYIHALVHTWQEFMVPNLVVDLRMLGGAMNRVAQDETAFAHRDKQVLFQVAVFGDASSTDAASLKARRDQFMQAVASYGSGAYIGFQEDKGEQGVREIYPPATYARLAALKRQYDPTNLFRMNQNIAPATNEEVKAH